MAALRSETLDTPRSIDRLSTVWQRVFRRDTRRIAFADTKTLELPTAMSDLLMQAVRENSNYELDWLWFASQTQSEAERLYCLGRAHYINPHSEIVRAI